MWYTGKCLCVKALRNQATNYRLKHQSYILEQIKIRLFTIFFWSQKRLALLFHNLSSILGPYITWKLVYIRGRLIYKSKNVFLKDATHRNVPVIYKKICWSDWIPVCLAQYYLKQLSNWIVKTINHIPSLLIKFKCIWAQISVCFLK